MAQKIKLIHDMNIQGADILKASGNLQKGMKNVKGEKIIKESIKNKHEIKPVLWKDVKEGINGYCRIIKYTNHSVTSVIDVDNMEKSGSKLFNTKAENLEIDCVEEGAFTNGMREGYCRTIYARD